jgi:hypothetical protein
LNAQFDFLAPKKMVSLFTSGERFESYTRRQICESQAFSFSFLVRTDLDRASVVGTEMPESQPKLRSGTIVIVAYSRAKRNHYNPCFWTALWNQQFFTDFCAGRTARGRSRAQLVHTLNLRGNRIFETKVENVHYDKGLGEVEITTASMLDFCRRHFPDKAEGLARSRRTSGQPVP